MTGVQFAWLAASLFVSACLQVTGGFGFALLAMPLVTLILGLDLAGPVVAATGVTLNLANTLRLHRQINRPELLRLAAAAACGVPLGFWLLARVPLDWARQALGALLIAYVAYVLWQRRRPRPITSLWVGPAGLAAGLLAGALNTPGPPVVVYGDLRGWARDEYRSTLQAFFLLSGLLVVGGHALLGRYDWDLSRWIVASLPALAIGNLAGQLTDRFLSRAAFRFVVLGLMCLSGLSLLI